MEGGERRSVNGLEIYYEVPQLLLCGLFLARDQMAGALEAVSYDLPLRSTLPDQGSGSSGMARASWGASSAGSPSGLSALETGVSGRLRTRIP